MKKIFFLITILSIQIFSQSSLEPLNNNVYDFLDRVSIKGIIDFNPLIKPLTRTEIIKYLSVIENNKSKLSSVEQQDLNWFLKEYAEDIYSEQMQNKDLKEGIIYRNELSRYRIFYYKDSLLTFNFTPTFRFEFQNDYEENQTSLGWGFSAFGSIANNLGFRINFNDNSTRGDRIDKQLRFNTEQGKIYSKNEIDRVDFSRTNGSIIYHKNWLTIGGAKENFIIGNSYRSQLILSTKSPSFPSIYMKLNPTKWLQFYFMHGWLLSGEVDSSASYQTDFNFREVERDKYYAMHAIQINPIHNLSFSIGETMIYSDHSPYFGYFIPFLIFRSVDHMFSYGGADAGNNGSLFFDAKYFPINNFQIYGSLFIDELSLTKLLEGNTDRNQLGFTLGTSIYDFGIDNLLLRLEYTRILPWVYSNWIPAQTYTNSNYLMGHYIGQNSDQIYAQINYYAMRGLSFKLWGEYIRRGGTSDIANQYTSPGEDFLYGVRRNDSNFGFEINYEFIYDLFIKLKYQYSFVEDEDKVRTPDWQLGNNHTFGFSINYGL
ncbi:MAG: hypothetical protein STSR0008_06220 [Ignavibacterium sp.]